MEEKKKKISEYVFKNIVCEMCCSQRITMEIISFCEKYDYTLTSMNDRNRRENIPCKNNRLYFGNLT